MNSKYLNVTETAEYLGISKWSVHKMVQRRKIPFIQLQLEGSKPMIRFDPTALDGWMGKNAIAPVTATPAQ